MREVFVWSLLTAVATWFWALPFLFFKKMSLNWIGIGNAVAAALMITASFGMVMQGMEYGIWWVVAGMGLWLIFIVLSDNFLHRYEHLRFGDVEGGWAHKILLMVGVMTAHSFTEGVAIWSSFGPSVGFGAFISLAMSIQNIPEWLAIALVMVPKWVSRWKAWLWAVFSSLPQPLMAVPAFLFVSFFSPFLPLSLGFAAGAMLWMSFSELMQEAYEHVSKKTLATIMTIAIMLMTLFQFFLD